MEKTNKFLVSRRRAEFFVYRKRFGFEYFCEVCGFESRFVALEDAMKICGLTMREIVRLTDAGAIHFLESGDGFLVVCQNSLPEKAVLAVEKLLNSGVEKNV